MNTIVSHTALPEEVKRQYRRIALQVHPDKTLAYPLLHVIPTSKVGSATSEKYLSCTSDATIAAAETRSNQQGAIQIAVRQTK
eukprot:1195407-Prorocentrum_minimum.AAC.4